MPSRRFHHKSSTGCQECKQQRVKCDENKPSCNRCLRQERSCSYTRLLDAPSTTNSSPGTSGGAAQNSNSTLTQGSYSASPATSTGEEVFSAATVSSTGSTSVSRLQDLELLHHWTLDAAKSFSKDRGLLHVWQDQAVRQALKYPFLMHAIFSFSALHLVSTLSQDLAPSRDAWLKRSAHDYGLALSLARPELENINPHNCHAVFAFSSIVAIYRLALPGVTGDYGDGGVLEHMMQTFHLLRGILAVLKIAYPWVKAGPLGATMQDIDDFEPQPIEPDLKHSLEALEQRITTEVPQRETRMAYYEAIQRMRLYFSHPPGTQSAAVQSAAAWPVLLQAEYMDDLSGRQPLALAILAYYSVILEEQRDTWWMVDQSKRLLISVIKELESAGGDWLDLVHCAQQRVRPENLYHILNFKVPKSLEGQGTGMIA